MVQSFWVKGDRALPNPEVEVKLSTQRIYLYRYLEAGQYLYTEYSIFYLQYSRIYRVPCIYFYLCIRTALLTMSVIIRIVVVVLAAFRTRENLIRSRLPVAAAR